MNEWVVETPTFEEDLMNNRVVMLNQNGVNRVVEIIKDKDKEIEKLKNKLKDIKSYLDYLETYSSKEEYFEDMERRLDRIDRIIGSDK